MIVPHYAMSGGTLIALAADEIVMDPDAVLGPVDPQLGSLPRGSWPAASILKALEQDNPNRDDETLILGDVAAQGDRPGAPRCANCSTARVPDDEADELAAQLSEGRWTHDYPITARGGEGARAARLRARARGHLRAHEPLPAPQPAAAVRGVHPHAVQDQGPRRVNGGDRQSGAQVPGAERPGGADAPNDDAGRPTSAGRGTGATAWSAGAWTGCTSRTGSRRIRGRRAWPCRSRRRKTAVCSTRSHGAGA